MKTWVPLNMNVTICQALCSVSLSVLAYVFVCVLAICYPRPEEGWGYCENQCWSKWALRGNPPQRFKEQLKANRSPPAAHCCISIYSLSLVHRGGRSTGGWCGGGFPHHNFSWVMNCEMQQKPPLLQEGFRAHRAIEEKRGKNAFVK